MLLLHEFHRRKFMLPDKLKAKDRERLNKAAQASIKKEIKSEEDADTEAPGIPSPDLEPFSSPVCLSHSSIMLSFQSY